MNDEATVRVFHRGANLQEDGQPFRNGKAAAIAVTVDRLAFDVFHHQERNAFGGDAAVEQASDVGMREVRQDLALGDKARHEEFRGEVRAQKLERDRLLELAVGAMGQVHSAHSAVGQGPVDLPRPETFARRHGGAGGRIGSHGARRGGACFLFAA